MIVFCLEAHTDFDFFRLNIDFTCGQHCPMNGHIKLPQSSLLVYDTIILL